jgi:hypothetical protein
MGRFLVTKKTIPTITRLYHEAIAATRHLPQRPKNPNKEYIEDIAMFGLVRADRATDNWNEPCRQAVPGELDGWDCGFFQPSATMHACDAFEGPDRVYHWEMLCFSGSTQGHMVVMAPSRIQARIRAVNKTVWWLLDNREHWFDHNNKAQPEYTQAVLEFWIKFFDGIRSSGETNRFLIIEGAE